MSIAHGCCIYRINCMSGIVCKIFGKINRLQAKQKLLESVHYKLR